MDGYRKGWSLRYLREARAELEAAREMPYMAPSLVLESIRKARNAIYYSLGDPAFIEIVVREAAEKTEAIEDPVLKCLVEVEETVQRLGQMQEINGEKVMKQADNLVQLATDIVETLTEQKIEE
jgi:hypothetical protein